MSRTPATVTLQLANGDLTGLFTFDESLFDGDDVFAGDFGGNVFFDISTDQTLTITRGMGPDLGGINQGTLQTTLSDPDGDFNPENPTSPLADDLDVMLPLRVQATHPDLFEDYATTVLADEPVWYGRLDEASGTVCRDSSGNGLNGTYGSAIALGQAGALSGDSDTAADFPADGTNGKISVADVAALRITDNLTIEAWVYIDSLAANRTVAFKGNGTNLAGPYRVFIGIAGGIVLQRGDGATIETLSGTFGVITTGGWHHIAVTVLGTAVAFYANAVAAGTATSTVTIADAGNSLYIGGNANTAAPMDGRMDEVAVYNKALSADRILAHYEAGRATGGDLRTVGLFYGFLRDYEHDPDLNVRKSALNAVDFFEWLAQIKPVIASTGPITEGAALGLILDAAQWTDPTLRDLDDGGTLADFSADGTQSGIDLIAGIVQISLGLFFVKGSGVVRYLSRETRFTPSDPVATLDGSLITGVKPRKSVDQVKNRITVTRTGGVAQEAVDDESRRKYGYRDASPITSPYFTTDDEALALAQLFVLLYGTPRSPVYACTLINRDDESILLQLTLEIGDRVVVQEASGGTDVEGEIVGIHHNFPGAGIHITRYIVSSLTSALTFFTFDDDSGASVFDGEAVFGY